MLTRDEILKQGDLQAVVVDVPEWGGQVRVRGLTGAERDEYERSMVGPSGKIDTANLRGKLAALSIVGDDGERLFSLADAEALGKKSAAALQRVCDAAQRLSGLRPDDREEALGN